jgi:hypothetical protein
MERLLYIGVILVDGQLGSQNCIRIAICVCAIFLKPTSVIDIYFTFSKVIGID